MEPLLMERRDVSGGRGKREVAVGAGGVGIRGGEAGRCCVNGGLGGGDCVV
jgi:hypothetical protein